MRVHGVGPSPARLMLVGEGPGWLEEKVGRPFVGKTGAELDRYFDGEMLPHRRQVYLTYLYRQFGGKDYEYGAADLERDEPDLLRELDRVQPEIIVPLGRVATRYFLHPNDTDMEAVHSIPWEGQICGECGRPFAPSGNTPSYTCPSCGADGPHRQVVIYPLYHPAAGMHNSDIAVYVVSGFHALSQYLSGANLQPRRLYDDPYPTPEYKELCTAEEVEKAMQGWVSGQPLVALDTEGYPSAPWSVQFSGEPGRAYLIRAVGREALERFGRILHHRQMRLLFHSALHDRPMMRALGCSVDGLPFLDTMVAAYLLQIEPLGLKAGCLRHCNMQMSSYMDLMGDKQNELAREYLTWQWDICNQEYEEECQAEFEWQVAGGRRLRKPPKLPRSNFFKAVQRVLGSTRPHGLWLDQDDAIVTQGIKRLGFMPEATLSHVEPEKAVHYGCRDADGTVRYHRQLAPRLKAMKLEEVEQLELGTYPLIDRMATVGVKPDLQQFEILGEALGWEVDRLREELCQLTGEPNFNANSGDHVASYLFERLGLEPLKMTKSRERGSTNDKILEALERANPGLTQIGKIREFRETYKLKHSFVDTIPAHLNKWPYDGRIHATFRTTRVVTGRLAASDPNLLAQPEHGLHANDFKRCWVAEDGRFIYQADESQVELRVLAHLSQDPVLLSVYRGERRNPDGSLVDLHSALAERIFGVAPHLQNKSQHRLPAKAVNFGISMGMTNKGLCLELRKNGMDISEDDAQRWLDETLDLYSGVKAYMARMIAQAEQQGYIRCLSGRIRYIGGIHSPDERVREEAERFSFSTPIQEGAQWLMKRCEAKIWEEVLPVFWRRQQWVEPILQVHDCLKFEAELGLEHDLHVAMTQTMTETPPGFSVPLAVEDEHGVNMADMTKF